MLLNSLGSGFWPGLGRVVADRELVAADLETQWALHSLTIGKAVDGAAFRDSHESLEAEQAADDGADKDQDDAGMHQIGRQAGPGAALGKQVGLAVLLGDDRAAQLCGQ